MQTPALLLASDTDHAIATWDRTMIQIWRRETSEHAAMGMCGLARTFAAKHPAGFNVLFIVESASAVPGSGARGEFARFTRETAINAACCVVVPEGGGFRSALVRSILIGLSTLLRKPLPYKFVDDVDAAIALLGPHLTPGSGGREALRAAVIELRERLAREK